MTREEAKEIIISEKSREFHTYGKTKFVEALDKAITALSQEQQSEWERDHEILKAYADGQESMKPCGDAISRQAVLDLYNKYRPSLATHVSEFGDALKALPTSVSTEKTDAYKQGWHDAITTALKETHNIRTDYGIFRVVQEETLIGVGMAYKQVSTEKTGLWIEQEGYDGDTYYDCSECGESFCLIDGTPTDNLYNYCPNCGAKMEVEE